MAKLAYYCCDPHHGVPCQHGTCEACKDECDPEAVFYGSLPQAVAKLARNQKKESTPNV